MNSLTRRFIAFGCVCMLVSPVLAADAPQEIIRKAIQAHGGEAALNKYPAGVVKSKGTITTGEVELKFVATNRYQLPNRGKNVIEMESKDGSFAVTQLFNGDKVEVYLNGEAQKLTDEQSGELRYSLYLQELYQLTPLLDAKIYTLRLLDESPKIAGEETAVVTVAAQSRKEVKLFFSKKSGLLIGLERKGTNAEGKEIAQVQTLRDHKTFDGILRPSKMTVTHDGKPFTDVTLDYKHFDKLPAAELEGEK